MAKPLKAIAKLVTGKSGSAGKLDLSLAWRRLKSDRPDRCFIQHLHLFDWIEADLDGWLAKVQAKIDSGYTPRDCLSCYAPKGGWMVRPGGVLEIMDELVFNVLIGNSYDAIWKVLKWSQGEPDVAYQLRPPTKADPRWLKRGAAIWREWRERSLARLKSKIRYVVFADISAFYENLDLGKLQSELNAVGMDSEALNLLMKCLWRWAQPHGKGIPQGYSASDILAKLYVNSVDMALRNAGFDHLRYVDDVRIFCKNRLEAKRALLKLNELLRNRGLNLQTAKTRILAADEARSKIDGVTPIITSVQDQLAEQLDLGPYATAAEVSSALKAHPDKAPVEVLEQAFLEGFVESTPDKFDPSLFHYLLNRLGGSGSKVAMPYCLDALASRPDETEYILRYLMSIGPTAKERAAVLKYAGSAEAIYDYQLYQIVRWFSEQTKYPARLIKLCRTWAFDKNRAPWLRSYSMAVLGIAGDPSDLKNIESAYPSASGEVEQAEIVEALAKMEKGQRNAFYAKVKGDGELVRRAVDRVKSEAPE